jgi:hypothetical protein
MPRKRASVATAPGAFESAGVDPPVAVVVVAGREGVVSALDDPITLTRMSTVAITRAAEPTPR